MDQNELYGVIGRLYTEMYRASLIIKQLNEQNKSLQQELEKHQTTIQDFQRKCLVTEQTS
jgi:hypothetical protein